MIFPGKVRAVRIPASCFATLTAGAAENLDLALLAYRLFIANNDLPVLTFCFVCGWSQAEL